MKHPNHMWTPSIYAKALVPNWKTQNHKNMLTFRNWKNMYSPIIQEIFEVSERFFFCSDVMIEFKNFIPLYR